MSKCAKEIAEKINAKNVDIPSKKTSCIGFNCKWIDDKCVFEPEKAKSGPMPWWVWIIIVIVFICLLCCLCSSLIKIIRNKSSGGSQEVQQGQISTSKQHTKKHKRKGLLSSSTEE